MKEKWSLFFLRSGKEVSDPLFRRLFKDLTSSSSWSYIDKYVASFSAPYSLILTLQGLLPSISEDLGYNISVLLAHRESLLTEHCLRSAYENFPNAALTIADVLLKEFSFGDYSSLPLLKREFSGLSQDLLLTAKAYLESDLSAVRASEALYIHRNTFNYRLERFINETSLDIREFHNALLFSLYLRFAN